MLKRVIVLWAAVLLSLNYVKMHTHSHGEHGHSHGHEHSHGHAKSSSDHGHSHGDHHAHTDTLAQGHGGHHGHSHGHSDEAPHFKYSKEANLPSQGQQASKDDSKTDFKFAGKESLNVERKTGSELWLPALLATVIVSAAPIIILLFIPLDNADEDKPFLKVLLSFASGGLLGDAFLHLIPHALFPHNHHDHGHAHGGSHQHEHAHLSDDSHNSGDHSHNMVVPLWILAGILAFLIVEKLVRHVKGGHSHDHSHSESHSKHAKKQVEVKKSEKSDGDSKEKKPDESDKPDGDSTPLKSKDKNESADKSSSSTATSLPNGDGEIKVSGYLNLAADLSHNFTDGLAIGASFMVSYNVGVITTVTILLHELPHEIGDFAILIQSGYTRRQAMGMQVVTGVGAMLGTVCSLLAEGLGDAAIAWILPFTAGGFIYIATVSVIPELLKDSDPWQSVKEILALLVGVAMMALIGQME